MLCPLATRVPSTLDGTLASEACRAAHAIIEASPDGDLGPVARSLDALVPLMPDDHFGIVLALLSLASRSTPGFLDAFVARHQTLLTNRSFAAALVRTASRMRRSDIVERVAAMHEDCEDVQCACRPAEREQPVSTFTLAIEGGFSGERISQLLRNILHHASTRCRCGSRDVGQQVMHVGGGAVVRNSCRACGQNW